MTYRGIEAVREIKRRRVLEGEGKDWGHRGHDLGQSRYLLLPSAG